jgi:uncharacterized surface protein with fasciclin (FAS1) repeats
MVKSMVVVSSIAMAGAASVTLASFGPSDATLRKWRETNDPVMGGKSSGKFTVTDGIGTMEGTVAIVPSLNAPGFINVEAQGKYADVSSCAGVELDVRTTSDPEEYTGWRFSFGTDKSACKQFFARGYHASFTPPSGDDFGKVQIPFNEFTRCWSDATGEAIKTCADDSSVCPTTARLQDLQSIQVWAEGKVGDVKIDIRSVSGYGCEATSSKNIAEIALGAKELNTLVAALSATDLVSTVAETKDITVFAPTNDAFDALGTKVLNCLLEPVGLPSLSDVLKYHVVPTKAESSELKNKESLATLDGNQKLMVMLADGAVTIEGGASSANVTKADILATNGVVHEINAVLLPENFSAPECGSGSIADTAVGNKDLSTLVEALAAADLVATFNGTEVFTVFAPTNDAFAAVPSETLSCLLEPKNVDALKQVLTYHVVAAYDLAADISDGLKVATLEGENLTFAIKNKNVMVDNATVVIPDVYANNGVVHVIDEVLIPADFGGCPPKDVAIVV